MGCPPGAEGPAARRAGAPDPLTPCAAPPSAPLVARVLPDVPGLDRELVYVVPPRLTALVEPGSIVRVPLQRRRARGWIVALERPEAAEGAGGATGPALREILEVVSRGPRADVVALARWAAWRYAGPLRALLAAASPPRVVPALLAPHSGARPARGPRPAARDEPAEGVAGLGARAVARATSGGASGSVVLRLAPALSRLELVRAFCAHPAVAGRGVPLVLVQGRAELAVLEAALVRDGLAVAAYPERWAEAASGADVVLGVRAGVLASLPALGGVLVLDAHAHAYVEERTPSWAATVLGAERARRAGAPCIFVSPCPGLELLALGELVTGPAALERSGWAPLEVLDRRGDDPRTGAYSPLLVPRVEAALDADPRRPVVLVLQRTGRARLLACRSCGSLLRCPGCGGALAEDRAAGTTVLACPRCGGAAARQCSACGGTALRVLRVGVARAAEELSALLRREVAEVSREVERDPAAPLPPARVLVGTEAVLHRARSASLVVFLDLDQHLLAPRWRAGEEALQLLALASRLVGGRRRGGRVVVQTRLPDHEVVHAAARGAPDLLTDAERPQRAALRLPPFAALALLEGDGAPAAARRLRDVAAGAVEVRAASAARVVVRAASHAQLCDALAQAAPFPRGVRVRVDPTEV